MQLKKIKIGKLHTENNIFCAPLAGYTNAPFRDMCRAFGAGLTFTEMVSAKGLCYGSEKTEQLLYVSPDYSGIKACQIFGAPRATATPSAPVSFISLSASSAEKIPPLAITGIFTAFFAFAISSKFTSPE